MDQICWYIVVLRVEYGSTQSPQRVWGTCHHWFGLLCWSRGGKGWGAARVEAPTIARGTERSNETDL